MDWLIERFVSAGERTAFIHHGTPFSYGQMVDRISSLELQLRQAGVGHHETVVVLADYAPEVVCMLLALARLRATVVPMTRGSVIEEDEVLSISGCTRRITFSPNGITWEMETHSLPVTNQLMTEFRRTKNPGLVLFSSGSTGKPKGMLYDFSRVVDRFKVQRAPVVAVPFLLLDHFGGINTILAITSSLGTVVTTEDRLLPTICAAIEKYSVDLLPTTPSFLTMLAATDLPTRYDLSSLKRITYGTETMPQATLDRIRERFPNVELQQTYGLSEVGVLRSQSRPDGSLWVRIGGQGFETQVREGILWVRSEFRMLGYLNAPSAFDHDGWFNTQDRVEVDGEWFKILGRVTDLINVAGQKVYPAEVEDVILQLPNVTDVVVKGEKHTLLGQIVVAHVALTEPEPLSELRARVRSACLSKLTDYKVPAKVVLMEAEMYSARFKKVRR
ncbi:class I adenylate-forming enzyme family protein [Mycobacterium marseillense]|nr:fatty acid--CoA ligase family protein [Mycobacterium marseillense]MCV7407854.1 AMP-binding protein [Mycobacterium marseillense]ORA93368.1 AMP-dependent synthetase [Mycobacterium marseillense]